ncbi:MAG: hypothetical protein IH945_12625 [Armatimonadetes bacterium]|nr:hypothetical protein [Armatimonadota bacterium]
MVAALMLALGQNFPEMPQYPIPTDAELQSALQIYQHYGLPLPPQGSQLVKYHASRSTDGEGITTIHWSIAYKLPGRQARLLRGLTYLPKEGFPYMMARPEESHPVSGDDAKALRGSSFGWFESNFESDSNLAMAIQMYGRGEVDLAKHFASGTTQRYDRKETTLQSRVYTLVAKYYLTQYADKSANVANIARVLIEIREQLDTGSGWNWVQREADSVIGAQRPFTSRPGTDERLVDELVYFGLADATYFLDARKRDPYFRAILARGVAIVPTLINHFDDDRATRHFSKGQMNGVDGFGSIQGLCKLVVGSLMSSRHVNRGSIIGDVEPQDWWESVKGRRETDVLKRAIFFHEEDALYDGDKSGNIPLNEIPLQIFELRYPNQMADLYLESFQYKGNSNEALARIIDKSSLPDAKKADLFRTAIDEGTASHKATATRYLKKYDAESAREALRTALKMGSPFGEGAKDHQASGLARQVMENGDEEMVRILVEKAMKEDTGVRVNVISGIYGRSGRAKISELRMTALRLFLDDATVHTTSSQKIQSGDYSDRTLMRWDPPDLWHFKNPVAVRDYAAWCIGRLIGVQGEPQEEWRGEEWAKYRGYVLDELKERDGGVMLSRR